MNAAAGEAFCIWSQPSEVTRDGAHHQEWLADPEVITRHADARGNTSGYTVHHGDGEFHLTPHADGGWDVTDADGRVHRYGFTDPTWVIAYFVHLPLREARIWIGGRFYQETFNTAFGVLQTVPVPMGELRLGHRFVGGYVVRDGEAVYPVYKVIDEHSSGSTDDGGTAAAYADDEQRQATPAVQLNPHGWLFVRDLTRPHVWSEHQRCWADEGFFSYSHDTLMNVVVQRWD